MEFIKKNILLTAVLSVALVAAVALIVFWITGSAEMDKLKKKRNRNIETIRKLNSQKLAPVQENVDNLGADLELLSHELMMSYRRFGAPSRDSFVSVASALAFDIDPRIAPYKGKFQTLAEFCESVEAKPEIERAKVLSQFTETIKGSHTVTEIITIGVELRLLERFTAFWEKEKNLTVANAVELFIDGELKANENTNVKTKDLYKKTLQTYKDSLEKVDVVKTVAGQEVKNSILLEPIDNINESLVNLFGLPIMMDNIPRKCKDYMQQYKSNLLLSLEPVVVKAEAENFSFDEFLSEDMTKSFPSQSQIPFVVEHWRAVSDIVMIINDNMKKLEDKEQYVSIDKIERIGEIEGIEADDFLKYKYLVEFSAPMEVVRETVNAIEKSVENDRVLIIKELTFNKVTDGVANFEKTLSTIQDAVKRGAKEYTSKGLIDPRAPESKEGYGWTIIGNDNVTASLVIENVSYIGNMLKAKK